MSRATLFRGRIGRLLADTYTRDQLGITPDDPTTGTVDESTGPWGESTTLEGGTETDPTTGDVTQLTTPNVPCMWIDAGSLMHTQMGGQLLSRPGEGTLIVDKPTLVVAFDDPLKPGDQVRHIVDKEGVVQLDGPAIVEIFTNYGPPGYTAMRACTLRLAQGV